MIILSDFLDVLNPSHVLKIKLGEENEGELNDKIDISIFFLIPSTPFTSQNSLIWRNKR